MSVSVFGAHVRVRTSYLSSPRHLSVSLAAQGFWLQLERFAVSERREFLPEEYTVEAMAMLLHQAPDQIRELLAELLSQPRPVIGVLHQPECSRSAPKRVPNGPQTDCDCHRLVRVRGARQHQPISWQNESLHAVQWNLQNPNDSVDVDAFGSGKVIEAKGIDKRSPSVPKRKRKGSESGHKVTHSDIVEQNRIDVRRAQPTALADCLPRLPDGARTAVEHQAEAKSTAKSTATAPQPAPDDDGYVPYDPPAQRDKAPPTPEELAAHGIHGPSPVAASLLHGLTVGWPPPNGHEKRALTTLAADPARVLAYCLDIADKFRIESANVHPWELLEGMCAKLPKLSDAVVAKARDMLRKGVSDAG